VVVAIGGETGVAGAIVSVRCVVVVVLTGSGPPQAETSRVPPSKAKLPRACKGLVRDMIVSLPYCGAVVVVVVVVLDL
jgi:hypothetical protein